MHDLTPRELVSQLDRFIIGQDAAKKAVAVAVRNRWRRQQLEKDLAREVAPKNIIMVGPTGVGKTEIARRLAGLVNAPFIKVEASKYTEVGYHGRDVESMVRDLLERSIDMIRQQHATSVREQAEQSAEDRLVSLLLGDSPTSRPPASFPTGSTMQAARQESWQEYEPKPIKDEDQMVESGALDPTASSTATAQEERELEEDTTERVRQRIRQKLRDGVFEDREIEITITEHQSIPIIGMMGQDQMDPAMSAVLEKIIPDQKRRRKVTVARARAILIEEETEKLIDNEKIIEQAIERAETAGVVFLDEIDKIATASEGKQGSADVSRQGVQRDLLPIVEGSTVPTRHGTVRTDGILFIAAGAFHSASVSDLMPELQGRFPIRVELEALGKEDFVRILTEPDNALIRQQIALLETEGMKVTFTDDAIDAMAEAAAEANANMENIGARRLMTVMECIVEEISFDAPDMVTRGDKKLKIDAAFVKERLKKILKDEDLSRFVL